MERGMRDGDEADAPEPESAASTTVRPRVTRRKSRTLSVEHKARRPLQARSQERFDQILAALEELLQTAHVADISFNDIAAKAGISPASINYLFPSMAAIQIELAGRYLRQSTDFILQTRVEIEAQDSPRWQDWLTRLATAYRDHCNQNRHVAEIILGPALHHDTRRAAAEQNRQLAAEISAAFHQFYRMPDIPELAEYMRYTMDCIDALWARSYSQRGYVDDDTFRHGVAIQLTYLRTILPETLLPRRCRDAAATHLSYS